MFDDLDKYSNIHWYTKSKMNPVCVGFRGHTHGDRWQDSESHEKELVYAKISEIINNGFTVEPVMGLDYCDMCGGKEGPKLMNALIIVESKNDLYVVKCRITHDIQVHNYKPPQGFILALLDKPTLVNAKKHHLMYWNKYDGRGVMVKFWDWLIVR